MPNGTAIATFIEGGCACLAVSVAEAGGRNVEYIGRVPLADLEGKSNAEKKAALVAAAKALRDAQTTPPPAAQSITGSVTL